MKEYNGAIPPCCAFCGKCPCYNKKNDPCLGAASYCKGSGCKVYRCSKKRGLNYCFECDFYPCNMFNKYSKRWRKYGQDIMKNQEEIKEKGAEKWLKEKNKECRS
ncbi:DUF3795 domain-containing protein [Clostridiaceae bacterium M8S5]|nr:DUF3795 domain-containing protein [Clostridiaceae bacterium M8S5]